MTTKAEYVAKMKAQLDAWSADIDVLEAKMQEAKDDAKVKYHEQLAALRLQRQEGEAKLKEIQAASESSWEHLKAETDKLWAAFKDSVHAFQAHYK